MCLESLPLVQVGCSQTQVIAFGAALRHVAGWRLTAGLAFSCAFELQGLGLGGVNNAGSTSISSAPGLPGTSQGSCDATMEPRAQHFKLCEASGVLVTLRAFPGELAAFSRWSSQEYFES